MAIKRICLLLILITGLSEPLFAQEKPLKEFAEANSERKYCLYPSTLRMINLQKDQDFNDFANSVQKLLLYQIEKDSVNNNKFREVVDQYTELGFEEYITMYGAGSNLYVYGIDKSTNEMIGLASINEEAFAFYLRGNIAWQKLPTMFNKMGEMDMLNFLDMNPNQWD